MANYARKVTLTEEELRSICWDAARRAAEGLRQIAFHETEGGVVTKAADDAVRAALQHVEAADGLDRRRYGEDDT